MEANVRGSRLRIAHISDIHVGSFHFVSNLLNRAIVEINEMNPDLVMVTGDLTNEGFRQQYSAVRAYLNNVECERMSVIPGNHDSRNVGYVHFEDFFGSRNNAVYLPGVTVVALDSSQPDLNEGRLGRQNYKWMVEKLSKPDDFKIVASIITSSRFRAPGARGTSSRTRATSSSCLSAREWIS